MSERPVTLLQSTGRAARSITPRSGQASRPRCAPCSEIAIPGLLRPRTRRALAGLAARPQHPDQGIWPLRVLLHLAKITGEIRVFVCLQEGVRQILDRVEDGGGHELHDNARGGSRRDGFPPMLVCLALRRSFGFCPASISGICVLVSFEGKKREGAPGSAYLTKRLTND